MKKYLVIDYETLDGKHQFTDFIELTIEEFANDVKSFIYLFNRDEFRIKRIRNYDTRLTQW